MGRPGGAGSVDGWHGVSLRGIVQHIPLALRGTIGAFIAVSR